VFVEKLTLFGFKSFNEKITLEFDAGISGIIGPNGCGKSNVVDAIRWVLGEQSTKQLRGAKMEDVIFNGTRREKPLSMAEVELTLNNDRGKLPIDFSTVSVGRRLYRSGVSEYTINKRPVRLKDVRELFMDTGMGSHAYSVIERQMVDNILSDTTGHRRFLFEEAAGIMKYKTRKREALTKLEATEGDLVRVNDIISEVDRQVASLRRQVGKARRYRELMEEIRNLDLAFSQKKRRAWQKELAAFEARYRTSLEAAESGETEVSTLDARLQETHLVLLEEERALSEARELLAQADDEVGRANSRILVLRERLEATRTRIREAEDLEVRLGERRERNAEADREARTRLEVLEAREGTGREELEINESSLREVETAVRELKARVAERDEAVSEARDARVRAEGDVVAVTRHLGELEERGAQRAERAAETEAHIAERRKALAASREAVVAAAAGIAELGEEKRVLGMRCENHGSRTEVLRRSLAEKREQEAAVRSRLSTLEDLRDRYEGFEPGVQALMLEDDRDAGVVGTLGSLIRVPKEWTAALEPALSSVWQHVVVTDTQAARRLIERLRNESLGFASLVPLDRVPATVPPPAGITWAADVVAADAAYRPLVRYVLDGLALVNDLDAALKIVREGAAPRAATRTGQFVDAAVISGGEGGPSGAGLVERQEAIERCRSSVAVLVNKLDELVRHEAELKDQGETLRGETARLETALEEATAARAALEQETAGLSLEIKHAEAVLGGLEGEGHTLAATRESLLRERESLNRRLEESRTRAAGEGAALADLRAALAAREAERETVLETVHALRMNWTRLEAEVQDCRNRLTHLEEERETLVAERERTVTDAEEARRRVVEIEEELETLAGAVQDLHVLRDERAHTVAEREREKSEAAALEQQDSESLRELRRKASGARQEAHELELRISELRGNVSHLESRIHEEYEIEAGELDAVPVEDIPEDAQGVLAEMKDRVRRLGPVNLLAVEEYDEKSQRLDFMVTQRDDLTQARDSLVKTIEQINHTASGMFLETFAQVQENFQKTFQVLFQGGECSLTLIGDDPLEADIDVLARPHGKKPQSIQQLSSGERALTAIALLFAIYLVKPSPFCILDEVDAPLDDANVDRFVNMVKEFSRRTQFIVITHNKKTMESADCLYGVTMQQPGTSSVVSVKLDGLPGNGRNGGGNGNRERDLSPESAIPQ
jgi:chromosome segregation protein